MKYAMHMNNHIHTYHLLVLEQNPKIKRLSHFRRSSDRTEHMQQVVKPLGYP